MVLNIPGIFGDSRGLPIEEKAVLARENGVMTIIKPGTQTLYWSCVGTKFEAIDATNPNYHRTNGIYLIDGADHETMCPVELPNNAVVTGVNVQGNAVLETNYTYILYRKTLTDNANSSMATASCGTEDTSISNATINNSLYAYFIYIAKQNFSTAEIYGARITYTLTDADITAAVVINTTAYAAEQNLKGFKGTYVLNNQTGAQQTINWNIQNITKSTTLESGTGLVIANGNYSTLSHPWSTEQVSSGDTIRFTITSGGIGTQGSGNTFGYASFVVESIEETDIIT